MFLWIFEPTSLALAALLAPALGVGFEVAQDRDLGAVLWLLR